MKESELDLLRAIIGYEVEIQNRNSIFKDDFRFEEEIQNRDSIIKCGFEVWRGNSESELIILSGISGYEMEFWLGTRFLRGILG